MTYYAQIQDRSVSISSTQTEGSLEILEEDALAFFEGRANLDDYEIKDQKLIRIGTVKHNPYFKVYTSQLDASGKMTLPTFLQHQPLYCIDPDDLTKVLDEMAVGVSVDFSTLPKHTLKVINGYVLIANSHP